jgi:hypothetical protein
MQGIKHYKLMYHQALKEGNDEEAAKYKKYIIHYESNADDNEQMIINISL